MKCTDCGYFERKKTSEEWSKVEGKDLCYFCKQIRLQSEITPEAKAEASKSWDELAKRRGQLITKHFLGTISLEEAIECGKVTLRLEELDNIVHPLNWKLFRNMRLHVQQTNSAFESLGRLLEKEAKR